MSGRPIRTVHVDIEGGWGGSSRSLFELVSRLPRDRVRPTVLYRQPGPIAERYAAIDVPAIHVPEIASFVPRPNGSWKIFLASLPKLAGTGRASRIVADVCRRIGADLVHLNYEGLFMMARRLRAQLGLPIVVHARTELPENAWARWLARRLAQDADAMFFISDREETRFKSLCGRPVKGEVMWNIATTNGAGLPHAARRSVVYLGNIDRTKGADRMVEIAAALKDIGAQALRVIVCGASRNDGGFGDSIRREIAARGLEDLIELRGFVREPESLLGEALALVRPSRSEDPWGRDVIEAISSGVPVIATGTYAGVVEPDVNGYLFGRFDPVEIARCLVRLSGDSATWSRMSENGRAKGERVFGGKRQVAQALATFGELTHARSER